MRRPRVPIAWVMLFTAVAAVDLAAIRTVFEHPGPVGFLLATGALPMANLLGFGLMVGCLHRGSRPFLLGFEIVGALALAFYVSVLLTPSDQESVPGLIVFGYLRVAWETWAIGAAVSIPRRLIAYLAVALWATWPQLAVAVAGGLFTRLPPTLRGRPFPEWTRG